MRTSRATSLWCSLAVCLTLVGAIPAGPGIEINPAAVFEDGQLSYVVVDETTEVEAPKNNQDAVKKSNQDAEISTTTTPSPPVTSGTVYRQQLPVVQPQPQPQYVQTQRPAVFQQPAAVQTPPQTQYLQSPRYQNPQPAAVQQPQTQYQQPQHQYQQPAVVQQPQVQYPQPQYEYKEPAVVQPAQFQQYPVTQFQQVPSYQMHLYQQPSYQQPAYLQPSYQQPAYLQPGQYPAPNYYGAVTPPGYYNSQSLPAPGPSYYSSSFSAGTPSPVNGGYYSSPGGSRPSYNGPGTVPSGSSWRGLGGGLLGALFG